MQKIITYLWFDKQCEEAMNFYVDVFKGAPSKQAQDSEITEITRYPEGYNEGPMAGMEGKVINGTFKLAGQKFYALDGGPIFKFNEAVSLYVECEDQAEIDYFWGKLSAVPESEQCGWLKDKFGLSWQIIPKNMGELLQTKSQIDTMLKMHKIVIADLEKVGKEK
ncbi:MAG TPA: VOC family protein [Candidatus Saccharimonadales bacterium]|nr:VOC family protein [Candidatus Saccharimonadales bacterium]